MIEPSELRALLAGSEDMPVLKVGRDGTVHHVSRAIAETLGATLTVGQPLSEGALMLTDEQHASLLAAEGPYSCRASLLRGEATPVGLTLVAVPEGDTLTVMLSVDVAGLIQLQDELGAINSQLTNLNRERVKAKARLERALAEVEEKNEELFTLNEELQTLNEELEAQTEALHLANEQAFELERENRHLHQLDELKNQFIGIISHELKTPLNFVTGFSSLLADEVLGPLSDRQAGAMQKVLTGAQRLDMLINELLDANKLQAGKLSVAIERVHLQRLVADLFEEMQPAFRLKEVALTCAEDCPPYVLADPQRLHQVLRNLLSNAVKFTPAGGSVRLEDTGIGIPDGAIGQLFQPFYQVDSTSTRPYGGTGLGLSIVKSLVELMGGEVGVESRVGQGSTFWFTLPIVTS
jgi:signal transduction histidine kinase